MKKTKIVAIGGAEIRRRDYPLDIDREIIKLSGKKKPRVLFIPTASSDAEGYVKAFRKHFGKRLDCETDELLLVNEKLSKKTISEKILSADIVYVGGGNTLKMMKIWRKLGVDKLLRKALRKGVVLCGVSAGAICWFEYGHSDSMSYYNPKNWEYMRVKGLGFIKGIHCPHYNGETRGVKRRKNFIEFMKKYSEMGIALDNYSAIEFINNKYRVITAKKNAGAYRVYFKNRKLYHEPIEKKKELMPLSHLYRK